MLKKAVLNLSPTDLIINLFYLLLSIINIVYYQKIHNFELLLALNATVILSIFYLAYLDNKYNNKLCHMLHSWYLLPLIFITFKELYLIIKPIHETDYDQLLIQIDRYLFGTDPTVFLNQFSHPIITEILQISYHMFYFLPIILGYELIRQNRKLEFNFALYLVVYGFLISYVGYLLVPAVGPRFTLHNFHEINSELPGLFLTNILRDLVNAGESIYPWTRNPIEVVQRDVFPSGHTEMTLIVMYLAYKFKTKSKNFIWLIGTLLIISTVYLRYHYVIDVIAGIAAMIFTIATGKYIFNWWQSIKNDEKISLN